MGPTRRAALFLGTVLALAMPGAPALAAEPTPGQLQAARDLFTAATKDEDAQRWQEALEKLRRVADVKLTAGVRYHIAFCEENLGQTATALAHYTEAQSAAQREHDKDVLDLLTPAFLTGLRARVPTLTIDVPDGIAGADVTLDGHAEPRGLWGVAVPVDPGQHHIEAHAPGRVSFTRELIVREREVTVLDATMPTLPAMPIAPPPPPREHAPRLPARSEPPPPSPSTASYRSLAAPLGTTIGAVLLAGGGIGAFVLAANAQSSGQTQCAARTSGNCDDLRTPVRDWDSVALGAWVGSAILATAAVVLWATPPARVTTTGTRLVLEGSF
jgi:hypothetical protein